MGAANASAGMLALGAGNCTAPPVVPRLEYYEGAGFGVVAAVPALCTGEGVVVTRMVRHPR